MVVKAKFYREGSGDLIFIKQISINRLILPNLSSYKASERRLRLFASNKISNMFIRLPLLITVNMIFYCFYKLRDESK